MKLSSDTLITVAATIGAIITIFGTIFAVYRWYLRQNEKDQKHDIDIRGIKDENKLIIYGLSACLDGLMQLGANHTVPKAKNAIDKYINEQAHK